MKTRRSWFVPIILSLALAVVCVPATASAAVKGRIVVGVGVKTAKLGLRDSTDARRVGGSYKRLRNTDYDFTVYEYRFGKKSHGHYGLVMYSKGNHHVFTFEIYSTKLVTKKGVHVGTTASTLVARYPSLKKAAGPVYTRYYMGTRTGLTEFYVRGGKVHHIMISRY